ncbi:SDR family NAD(P)-dependent oxidoreductase [Aeromicrobium fastidiosum]|uniref:SDR family NAD(P)-dependent oxidoreductase n=1 Tax=Aeromicrobium fastidiosum TaxID=52699 RepID=A0A641APM1_9ACTN|nr:SDR family NAD(P)-dependent oxidoreductase [Aeromicrobium fastidiosum]KAA1379885.1 SDR family NAD(P)-dependent oxidoreductase [Aeromicrobium fastidiosum]MBP2389389.1 NAD(P)-dependent dehydrogenase (short-subunit alcohol dehydrogenase family) [Aeromicrobium fastidiosum]
MDMSTSSAVVTGGASGLGLATVSRLLEAGALHVTIADLPMSDGLAIAESMGERVSFVPADVRNVEQVEAVFDDAESHAPVRVLVHCAGRGGAVRLVNRDGTPGDLDLYTEVVTINLIGTFNVLRLAATRMAKNDPIDGDRGVCILTASVAAFEGQIGQIPYASAKAGIVGMTIVAARDLGSKQIRVCTIAPGTFETPLLSRLPDKVKDSLAQAVPHPSRLGEPGEYAKLALSIIDNGMLNGETIRLDGAIRMAPR